MTETLSAYGALTRILDIHYQATSRRYPEGECAVCCRMDFDLNREVGVRFPCPTVVAARAGIGLDDDA
jgi:hypothetical protein